MMMQLNLHVDRGLNGVLRFSGFTLTPQTRSCSVPFVSVIRSLGDERL
jgi:hypothetical protein